MVKDYRKTFKIRIIPIDIQKKICYILNNKNDSRFDDWTIQIRKDGRSYE